LSALRPLREVTVKEESFLQGYYSNQLSAHESYIKVYNPKDIRPGTVVKYTRRILKRPAVQARLVQMEVQALASLEDNHWDIPRARYDLKEGPLMQEWAILAFSDVSNYVQYTPNGDLELKNLDNIGAPLTRAIQSLKIVTRIIPVKSGESIQEVTTEFKLHPKVAALENLTKILKLYEYISPEAKGQQGDDNSITVNQVNIDQDTLKAALRGAVDAGLLSEERLKELAGGSEANGVNGKVVDG